MSDVHGQPEESTVSNEIEIPEWGEAIPPEAQVPTVLDDTYYWACLPGHTKGQKVWRASKYSDIAVDKTLLNSWKNRQTVLGMLEIVKMRIEADPSIGKALTIQQLQEWINGNVATLESLANEAWTLSGAERKANLGTSIHADVETFMESGMLPEGTTQERIVRVEGIAKFLRELGNPLATERIVCLSDFNIVGRFDHCIATENYGNVIVDLKTGKEENLQRYGSLQHSVQLAIYANADYWWDFGRWSETPHRINLATALILSVPENESKLSLYEVDIATGVEYMNAIDTVLYVREHSRKHRKEIIEKVDERDLNND